MKVTREVKVGLLALVAGAVLYIGFNFLKGVEFFSPVKRYYIIYSNIDGLSSSNPVIMNGLNVGRVNSIQLLTNRNYKILVGIDVDDELVLGDSTIAILSNSDLLGGKEILLKLGKGSNIKKNGDTLTGIADKNLTQALAERAMPILSNLDSTVLKMNRVFGDELGNSIQKTLHNFEVASNDLRMTVSVNKQNINTITSNLADLSASLKETQSSLKPLMAHMNQFADSLNDLELKRVVNNANIAMKNLSQITAKINSGDGTMGALLNDKAAYDNMNKSMKDLDALLMDLKANPKRYVHFSVFPGKTKTPKQKKNKNGAQPNTQVP
ncbi:MAG TPA: MlaD family protein [Cytophagaceae bacterium]|nr:MlaD family protein [Cytophagaceae bacterium]